MLEIICKNTEAFIQRMPKTLRKQYGQFFTSMETARFMASLFSIPEKREELSILDAGAGSGILCVALLERLSCELSASTSVKITCYENDPSILPLLKKNLETAKAESPIKVALEIKTGNYIVSQRDDLGDDLFATPDNRKYDLIIGNPPYKKIGKSAPEAAVLKEVCHGAPNLYFLFATMGIHNLKDGAEMVYITPRSWTSGAYFEQFRKYLFTHAVLSRIHLFESRNKVFDKESVLQETMIFKLKKTSDTPRTIPISTTESNRDFANIRTIDIPYDVIVSGPTYYVHLVTDETEIRALRSINKFSHTLADLGLKMKTGLVVDFRSRDLLRKEPEKDAIPLIYSQHIREGRVRFPQGKDNEYIIKVRKGLMQENKNYLFVKRFTSKEERRRLQCGIYLKRYLPGFPYISSQNKVNFIDGKSGISECVIYGLYVIFNSTLYDTYYRALNGSTQVNSTEINSLPMPSMQAIESMGKELLHTKDLSEVHCNQILESHVYG
ncbi:MAG: Eco57I restriction-modification methylase domain-containing protein [Fibrobacteraceae bacterium]|nr:Eco57I restriction-modification methylase domain-containing protein [Fibrobacteraceae bacterium]